MVNYKKGCIRLAAANDKVYQLLAHGRWFSPGTPASSTTKTGRHDIAEILLKVKLNTINQINQMASKYRFYRNCCSYVHVALYKWYTFFCNLQSRVRTHAVLVIGLYELLGNTTT
jgi:hypothetical protein